VVVLMLLGLLRGWDKVAEGPLSVTRLHRHIEAARLAFRDRDAFLADPALEEEVFGAAALVVRCADAAEIAAILEALEGQLTAALHMDAADHEQARALLPLLERKVGRILVNGFGTGVEVCHAMVHGGPFPSTADGRSTSVGSLAIARFLRPVCYQDMPDALLPPELKGEGAPDMPVRRDGRLVKGSAA